MLCAMIFAAGFLAQESKQDLRFEKLKGLAGEWVVEGREEVMARYRVTAGGTAVLETLFPDTEKEMVTVYTLDGDEVKLTHYCMLGNQPVMRAGKMEKGALTFRCDEKVGGAKSHDDPHMHSLTMTFLEDGKVRHDWGLSRGGKEVDRKRFELSRKK